MTRTHRLWILLGPVMLLGCGQRVPEVSQAPMDIAESERALPPTGGEGPVMGQQFQGFSMSGGNVARQSQWQVQGTTASLVGETIQLNDVDSVRQTTAGQAHITAAHGTFHPQTRDVHLEGDVIAKTADGMVLKTDALDWSEDAQTLTTNAPMTMTRGNLAISSIGGQAQSELKTAAFASGVEVTVYPSTIITCDGALEVDYDRSKAIFHENVHVTDERGELFADVLEVFFTPDQRIQQVLATGHVRIVRGEDTAYAEEAIYLQAEGKVLLKGSPKLVLFPNGQRIE